MEEEQVIPAYTASENLFQVGNTYAGQALDFLSIQPDWEV